MKTVLFQGDSITDCGRNRNTEKEYTYTFFQNGKLIRKKSALGDGYPFLVSEELKNDADCNLLSDGVHPTQNGHGLIKNEWLKAFEKLI